MKKINHYKVEVTDPANPGIIGRDKKFEVTAYDVIGENDKYIAIKLKVPDSGADWLDDMIRESLHDDFAAKAMQAIVSNGDVDPQKISQASHIIAEAMLKASQV
jgi:hypothetical protein